MYEIVKRMAAEYPSKEYGKKTKEQLKYVAENKELLLKELEESEKLENTYSEIKQLPSPNSPKKTHARTNISGKRKSSYTEDKHATFVSNDPEKAKKHRGIEKFSSGNSEFDEEYWKFWKGNLEDNKLKVLSK